MPIGPAYIVDRGKLDAAEFIEVLLYSVGASEPTKTFMQGGCVWAMNTEPLT